MDYFPQWFLDSLTVEDRKIAEERNVRTDEKLHFVCPSHGVYYKRVGDVICKQDWSRRGGCPKCGKQTMALKIRGDHKFPKWFLDLIVNEDDRKLFEQNKVPSLYSVQFKCSVHGEFTRKYGSWAMHLTDEEKSICPRCGKSRAAIRSCKVRKESLGPYPDWFIDILVDEEDKRLARTGELDIKKVVKCMCPKHGVYQKRVNDMMHRLSGTQLAGCQKCNYGGYTSKMENEVVQYLRSLGIRDIEQNVKGYLDNKNYELDIYIPDRSLAIEVNGSYYHATIGGSEEYEKDINYHRNKWRQAYNNGIHLISLFDVDWNLNNDRVKSVIHDMVSKVDVIGARKTTAKEPSKEESIEFLNENHLQGYLDYIKAYGLYYQGS